MSDLPQDTRRWRRIDRILSRAFELSDTDRRAFLSEAFAAEPDLREEVEAVLRVDARDGGLLDRPVGEVVSRMFAGSRSNDTPHDRAGSRLGRYELLERLGWGGMGEVYRARESGLGRTVAVKLLRPDVANDPDILARLHREARLLGSLEHPRIARLYAFDEFEGARFLAMELIRGQTLAARLERGALPVAEALRICGQIAEGLDAAHLLGVVHRDLKPSNVLLDEQGDARLVDFGIAREHRQTAGRAAAATREDVPLTGTGIQPGTVPYMSPEQVRGLPVDARTDIWALGCTLFECLTGVRAFQRSSGADTLAAILGEEPDWGLLPATLPPGAAMLLRRMLQRDPRERQRSAGNAWFELTASPGDVFGGRERAVRRGLDTRKWALVGGLAIMAMLAAGAWWPTGTRAPTDLTVRRFEVPLPGATRLPEDRPALAMSSDGRVIAFEADGRIWLRRIDRLESTPVPGSEGARLPVFSPDGTELAFWKSRTEGSVGNGTFERVTLAGSAPVFLGPTVGGAPESASWGEDDRIYYAAGGGHGILRIGARDQNVETLLTLPTGEYAQGPRLLPGGEWLIFSLTREETVWGGRRPVWGAADVVVQSLRSGERRVVLRRGADPRLLPGGQVLMAQEHGLLAVAFDPASARTRGLPAPVLAGLQQSPRGDAAQYDVSAHGDLVYLPGTPRSEEFELVWVHRDGRIDPLPFAAAEFSSPVLSPDGTMAAVAVDETYGLEKRHDIWILHVARGSRLRLTSGDDNLSPVWSPDSRWIYFASGTGTGTDRDLWRRRADRSANAERVLTMEGDQQPDSITTDGRLLLFTHRPVPGGPAAEIWALSLVGEPGARRLTDSVGTATGASAAPDGRHFTFAHTPTGGAEPSTWLQEIATGRSYPVRTGDGASGKAVWDRDGDRILFVSSSADPPTRACAGCSGAHLREVEIAWGPRPEFSGPRTIAALSFDTTERFAAAPDGDRFLLLRPLDSIDGRAADRLRVELNRFARLADELPERE